MDEGRRTQLLEEDRAWRALDASQRRKISDLIREVANTGVSTAVSETVEGVSDTAVGCGFPGTPLFAALAIPQLPPARGKADPTRLATSLHNCAARIQKRLGSSPASLAIRPAYSNTAAAPTSERGGRKAKTVSA